MDEWELYDKLMAQHCPSDSTTENAQIACKSINYPLVLHFMFPDNE